MALLLSLLLPLPYPLVFNSPDGGVTWEYTISFKNLPGCQQMAILPNGVNIAENFNHLSRHTNVTENDDRQTDGR